MTDTSTELTVECLRKASQHIETPEPFIFVVHPNWLNCPVKGPTLKAMLEDGRAVLSEPLSEEGEE